MSRPQKEPSASEIQVSTAQGLATTKLGGSYATALNIWIGRFREAQQVIRELEAELDAMASERDQLKTKLVQMGEVCSCKEG